jgi:glycosyltransferase involved in cell wall biosynthesis
MIKISVVTITYNAADVLKRTLDSVLNQTYQHIEHLIVDGASLDDTLEIANDYKDENDEVAASHDVIITSAKDKGLYDAMNKGLMRATGDYVLFLNAGDFLPSSATIETVVDVAKRVRQESGALPAVIYGDTDIVDSHGNYLHPRHHRPPHNLTWRSFRYGMLVCHQAFYARLDIAQTMPYDLNYRFSADVDWCIRIMKAAARENVPLLNLHMVVANYTQEGQTTLHHRESLIERYKVMESHYGRISTFLMHCWFAVRAVFKKSN